MPTSNKREAINKIFEELYSKTPNARVLKFNNEVVKSVTGLKFSNQFDATKFETTKKLPSLLKEKGFFIVHLGKGYHAFVKGEGYHKFEEIKDIVTWPKSKSCVDKISDSEAQSVSTAFNDKIIHEFLFEDIKKEILVHTARRSKIYYKFVINGEKLETNALQIELDGIYETDNTIATVEAKNTEHEDFEIRQLFSAMKYFEQSRVKEHIPQGKKIRHLFLIRVRRPRKSEEYFKVYEYKFTDTENPNSIKLVKCKQYNLK